MNSVSMKQLLEAGVHFGHPSRRWNPKMKPYIYTDRNGIYIIDLKKTLRLLRAAMKYARDLAQDGGTILFVGTKKQAREIIAEQASLANMPYVNNRWLGGLMTNFQTIRQSVEKLIELERMFEDGSIEKYNKKEQSKMTKEMNALRKNLGGIKNMTSLPDALFIIDPAKDQIAVMEARKLNIPIIAVLDTNCDPDQVDYIIPGNDDAVRAIKLMVSQIAESCIEGRMFQQASMEQESDGELFGNSGPLTNEELEQQFNVYQGGDETEASDSDASAEKSEEITTPPDQN